MARSLALALAFALLASSVAAQQSQPVTYSGFDVGFVGIGPNVGIGGLGAASAAFGGRFEYGAAALPSMGNGILGIGVAADIYSYSDAALSGVTYRYIPIGVTANYHFRFDDKRYDPFIGLGLGYSVASVSGNGVNVSASSGIYGIARLGFRYFFSPRAAVQADVGGGSSALNFAVMFRM
jgi:Outer membrane protein beta-barrel domain